MLVVYIRMCVNYMFPCYHIVRLSANLSFRNVGDLCMYVHVCMFV